MMIIVDHKKVWKIMFNILGVSAILIYIGGILVNLNHIVTVTMGVIGIAYAIVKLVQSNDERIIKRIERQKQQQEYKKYKGDQKKEDEE
jgi:uncharacterized protein YycO